MAIEQKNATSTTPSLKLYLSEMEYTFCSDKKLVTRRECKDSCLAMNTDTETGWTLASIPTRSHNEQARHSLSF